MSTRQHAIVRVSLTDVISTTLKDVDLIIQETGVVAQGDLLPNVQGDPTQLGPLFQNLLSNDLTFQRTESTYRITAPALTRRMWTALFRPSSDYMARASLLVRALA